MEERVKERLTGAALIVALVVLLVPEMFRGDGTAGTSSAPQALDGPPLRSYTIELDKPGSVPTAPPVSEVPAESLPVAAATSAAAVPASAESSPTAAPTTTVEPTTTAVVPPAAASLPPATAMAPVAATVAAPMSAAPSTAGWVVQVGSFSKRENAERMVQQAGKKGVRLAVAGPDGRGLYRVRTAPVADRRAAAELQARLKTQGFAGVISASQ